MSQINEENVDEYMDFICKKVDKVRDFCKSDVNSGIKVISGMWLTFMHAVLRDKPDQQAALTLATCMSMIESIQKKQSNPSD